MANHKSAKKRARQTVRRTDRASQTKKAVRTAEKALRVAIGDKKVDEATELLKVYTRKMGKATQKGFYHMNTMARKVSRLATQVSQISK